jgi:hypothetical protein
MKGDPTWDRAFGGLKPKKKTEALLHTQIAKYMKAQYPRVRFHSSYDGELLAGGVRQGVKMKTQNWGPGFPDMMIFFRAGSSSGLALEIKVKSPYKKNGELLAGTHLKEQSEWLEYLFMQGWDAYFIWEFDQAKKIIDEYLKY